MESELKELLHERAENARIGPAIPAHVVRRAQARRKRTMALTAVLTFVVVAASALSIRAVLDVEPPERPGMVGGWPGIWPQDTRAKAELAQELVDARVEGLDGEGAAPESLREALDVEHLQEVLWQLDANEVAARFGIQVLGWPAAFASTFIGPSSVGPVTLVLESCDRDARALCRPDFRATVTLERLLRPDRFGLWFVTSADQDITPAASNQLVRRFLETRLASGPVDTMVAASAAEIYETGEAGLSLHGGDEGPFISFEIASDDPAGENTLLFLVRLAREEGVVAESLLVGPGVDLNGDPKPVLVLSVSRVEYREIDATVPPPVEEESLLEEEEVIDFVSRFMEARLAGSGAEVYLSTWALTAYESHERLWHPQEKGLYLYGTPDGDPTVTYVDFRIRELRGWDGTCDWVPPSACQDAWRVVVVTDLAPADGSAAETMQETLWVAPADGAAAEFADWTISAAARGEEPEGHT